MTPILRDAAGQDQRALYNESDTENELHGIDEDSNLSEMSMALMGYGSPSPSLLGNLADAQEIADLKQQLQMYWFISEGIDQEQRENIDLLIASINSSNYLTVLEELAELENDHGLSGPEGLNGFFSKIKDGIKKVANKVGNAIKENLPKVVSAAASVVSTLVPAGSAAAKIVNSVTKLSNSPTTAAVTSLVKNISAVPQNQAKAVIAALPPQQAVNLANQIAASKNDALKSTPLAKEVIKTAITIDPTLSASALDVLNYVLANDWRQPNGNLIPKSVLGNGYLTVNAAGILLTKDGYQGKLSADRQHIDLSNGSQTNRWTLASAIPSSAPVQSSALPASALDVLNYVLANDWRQPNGNLIAKSALGNGYLTVNASGILITKDGYQGKLSADRQYIDLSNGSKTNRWTTASVPVAEVVSTTLTPKSTTNPLVYVGGGLVILGIGYLLLRPKPKEEANETKAISVQPLNSQEEAA